MAKQFKSLRQIEAERAQERLKWDTFARKVRGGPNFGNEEVKRALAAGYTIDDVNGYLKYSGVTPKGDFAVGGYKENSFKQWGTKDSGSVSPTTTKNEFYRYTGPAQATPAKPAETPKPAAPSTPNTSVTTPQVGPVNPELMIPKGTTEMNAGDSIRLVGENLGIKAKRSSAQKSQMTSRGTGRLTIPRSSGYQPLNLGM